MNDGAVKAILAIMAAAAIAGLAGIAFAFYLKYRLKQMELTGATASQQVFWVLFGSVLLFLSSILLAAVFLTDYRFSWSEYLAALTISGAKFLILTTLAVFVTTKLSSSRSTVVQGSKFLAVGAIMVMYPWLSKLYSGAVNITAAIPQYFVELFDAAMYPVELVWTLLTDPDGVWWLLQEEFWSRFGNHFEMMELYGPFFLVLFAFSLGASALSHLLPSKG